MPLPFFAMPAVSVILSTHNNPRFLELVLVGYARQSFRDFEILIADDGSRDETRAFLERVRPSLPVPLTHVWRAHRGYYGKMAMMNRAIVAAKAEYVILADGDVIPRDDFVASHIAMRRPGYFVPGGDFRLSPEATAAMRAEFIADGRAFDYAFLRSIGQAATRRRVKLWRVPMVTRAMDRVNFSPARWSGSNTSAWKQDLVRVNGCDETFRAPGKDDTELGHRLWNAGVKSRHARHNTICLHLHHGMGNYSEEGRRANLALLEETIRTQRKTARHGIEQIDPSDHTIM